jgi:hypothetical protein
LKSKSRILVLVIFCCCCIAYGQNAEARKYEWACRPGAQLGYSNCGKHKTEMGANFYWAAEKKESSRLRLHIFGPFVNALGQWDRSTFYVGQQAGLNYHFVGEQLWSLRFSAVFENNYKKDRRIGFEAGTSFLGVGVYAGYYHPVGAVELKQMSRVRIGLRIILNTAGLVTSSPFQRPPVPAYR